MGYRQSDLQPAFNVPGSYDFMVWGYGTTDTLEEILQANYMPGNSSILRTGDLIYIKTQPRRDQTRGEQEGETRAAIVMVCGWERGYVRLRLVQDFGRPEDGFAAAAEAEGRVPAMQPGGNAGPRSAIDALSLSEPATPARRTARLPGRRSRTS